MADATSSSAFRVESEPDGIFEKVTWRSAKAKKSRAVSI
jgi:hypothetical protein